VLYIAGVEFKTGCPLMLRAELVQPEGQLQDAGMASSMNEMLRTLVYLLLYTNPAAGVGSTCIR
jgi:hypothetical protein